MWRRGGDKAKGRRIDSEMTVLNLNAAALNVVKVVKLVQEKHFPLEVSVLNDKGSCKGLVGMLVTCVRLA